MSRHPWDGGEPQQPLQHMQAKHRTIARLLIQGATQTEIAELMDMTKSRLNIIVKSPAFQDHLEQLESEADKSAVDLSKKIRKGTKRGLNILLNVLDEHTEESAQATMGQRIQVAQDFLDRNADTSRVSRSQVQAQVMHVTKEDLDEIKKSRRSTGANNGKAIDI